MPNAVLVDASLLESVGGSLRDAASELTQYDDRSTVRQGYELAWQADRLTAALRGLPVPPETGWDKCDRCLVQHPDYIGEPDEDCSCTRDDSCICLDPDY